MNQTELKTKIQQIINQKEQQMTNLLNCFHQQLEEIGTLKRLRDFEGEQLLMCLGWLSIERNQPQLTSVIKKNLLATVEKEVALIAKSNPLTEQLAINQRRSEGKRKLVMNKPTSETIYNYLGSAFWTKRKCWNCQRKFTKKDYQERNYYLTFQEILNVRISQALPEPRDNACLDGVLVKLSHEHCETK